eukprot:12769769-Heterocapsa_arctica.AAC.1
MERKGLRPKGKVATAVRSTASAEGLCTIGGYQGTGKALGHFNGAGASQEQADQADSRSVPVRELDWLRGAVGNPQARHQGAAANITTTSSTGRERNRHRLCFPLSSPK